MLIKSKYTRAIIYIYNKCIYREFLFYFVIAPMLAQVCEIICDANKFKKYQIRLVINDTFYIHFLNFSPGSLSLKNIYNI